MLQMGIKGQVECLTKELNSAQAFLQKIDKVPPDQLDKQVKIWADEVREASYDMDDVLDTFLVRVMGPKPTQKNKLKRLQQKMANLFSKTKARREIANAIEEINKKVKEIDERRRRYKLDDHVASPATPFSRMDPCITAVYHGHMASPATPSSSIDPRIAAIYRTKASLLIDIEERKDDVIKILFHGDDMSEKKTKVVSLVGFGGVGKTTLAKATYDQLRQQYECGAFVSVGQKPDLVKIFKDILFHLDKEMLARINSTHVGPDVLIPGLLDFLRDKRYLVVIDDVWDTQSRKRILEALTENNFGSKIIITTRKAEVAIGEVYTVKPLSEDNSKRLFYTRIIGGEDKCLEVSKVADKILKKCGGVPLAIITMASYLVGKSMEEWLEVCNSIGFCGKDKEQTSDTEWILSLSYYDLPSHLKSCLLYLSVFPEDHLISKDALIWMWIAEGFVDNGKPGDGLFEIGEGYFNELINRSLIQPVEEEYTMIVVGCRVHDMILDLIRSLSREANFAMVLDNGEEKSVGSNARRFALHNRVVKDTQNSCMNTTRARSLITFSCSFVPHVWLKSSKLLRMLYLEECNSVQLEHVGGLHHLRFLGIHSKYGRYKLVKEIGALKFLRVLYLDHVESEELLPSSVCMLTQLVCLYVPSFVLPSSRIKDLTSLQELRIHSFGDHDMSKGQFMNDLCNLSELRVLHCYYIDMSMESDFLTSIGSNLHKLQRLEMRHCSKKGISSWIDTTHLPMLSHLSLCLYSLGDQDLEILGGLPHLSYLCLTTHGRATLTGTAHGGC